MTPSATFSLRLTSLLILRSVRFLDIVPMVNSGSLVCSINYEEEDVPENDGVYRFLFSF